MIKFLKDELNREHDRNDHLQKMIENQQVLMLKNQEILEIIGSRVLLYRLLSV